MGLSPHRTFAAWRCDKACTCRFGAYSQQHSCFPGQILRESCARGRQHIIWTPVVLQACDEPVSSGCTASKFEKGSPAMHLTVQQVTHRSAATSGPLSTPTRAASTHAARPLTMTSPRLSGSGSAELGTSHSRLFSRNTRCKSMPGGFTISSLVTCKSHRGTAMTQ